MKKPLAMLVVGFILGAIAMRILDANRPAPLFSSANEFETCLKNSGYYQIVAEMNNMNNPDIPQPGVEELEERTWQHLRDIRESCSVLIEVDNVH